MREEAVDAGRRPGRDATAKEAGVFRPDRTSEGQGGCENWPVIRVARAKPLSRFGFKVPVEIWVDDRPERGYGSQRDQSLRGIATALARLSQLGATEATKCF